MGIQCKMGGGLQKLLVQSGKIGQPSVSVGIIDNPEIATYATYNEFGWVQRVTGKQSTFLLKNFGLDVQIGATLMAPPRPFMRATYAAKIGEWNQTLRSMLKGKGLYDPRQALEMVGRQAQVDIQETIKNGGVDGMTFPERSPLTLAIYQALDAETSSGNERRIEGDSGSARSKPLLKSGKMLGAIGYQIRGA